LILNNFSKIFESIVHDHVSFNFKPKVHPNQHGFIKSKSAVSNLIIYLNDVLPSDDTFMVQPHGRDELEKIQKHLISIHPNIRFMMEIEEGNSLPLLGALVKRKRQLTGACGLQKTHTYRSVLVCQLPPSPITVV
jgi:hypothetical protein